MTTSLKDKITSDMKDAMRAGEKDRLTVIRLVKAAIQRREIDDQAELDEAGVLKVVEKLVKQGQDSAKAYTDGGRQDLADKELAEIAILSAYLPEPLGEEELDALIDGVIEKTGAGSLKDMGKVMNEIKAQAQGRADMGAVSARVKARLAG